jgi:hypothetical protein
MKNLQAKYRAFERWFDNRFGWFISPKKYYNE